MASQTAIRLIYNDKKRDDSKKSNESNDRKEDYRNIDRNSEETAYDDHFMEVNIIKDRN